MGMECPFGCGYQPIVRTITHDFKPAKHASDVVAYELKCGHQMGGEAYKEYDAKRHEVIAKFAEKRVTMENEQRAELGTLMAGYLKK